MHKHIFWFIGTTLLALAGTACDPGNPATGGDVDAGGTTLPNPDAGIERPATCADVKAATPAAVEDDYLLYLGHDAAKPWTAHCVDMNTTPKEYLNLVNSNANFGQYTAGGSSPGSTVKTIYRKIRIDPVSLRIDTNDQVFASSSGSLLHSNGADIVTSMPLGVAMNCAGATTTLRGVASIDLAGTHFALTTVSQFCTAGAGAGGSVSITADKLAASIQGYGSCGWTAPKLADASCPFNPYNLRGSNALTLVYVP